MGATVPRVGSASELDGRDPRQQCFEFNIESRTSQRFVRLLAEHERVVYDRLFEQETKRMRPRVVSARIDLFGEFDPGSGQTLAACVTHASRTHRETDEWRTGEQHVDDLSRRGGYRPEMGVNPAYEVLGRPRI